MGLENPSGFEPFMRRLVASERFFQHPDLTAACIQDAFEASAQPFVLALRSTLTRRARTRDVAKLQYHLLLALRELQVEKIEDALRLGSDRVFRHIAPRPQGA